MEGIDIMGIKKKVILFLVEGISEDEALSALISNIIKNDTVAFQIMYGDVTSDINSSQQNIRKVINEKI